MSHLPLFRAAALFVSLLLGVKWAVRTASGRALWRRYSSLGGHVKRIAFSRRRRPIQLAWLPILRRQMLRSRASGQTWSG